MGEFSSKTVSFVEQHKQHVQGGNSSSSSSSNRQDQSSATAPATWATLFTCTIAEAENVTHFDTYGASAQAGRLAMRIPCIAAEQQRAGLVHSLYIE
jgi:hypothetical protein